MAINILSWNVNGLNSPVKRTKCLDYLRSKKVSIALCNEVSRYGKKEAGTGEHLPHLIIK